ncbi:hypothetical protein BHE74_00019937 [Ensete ventricosum]|nr:hypothetical protein GW17_00040961 [Ensete ventricosum]RWW72265.1 hypothetical protein BHE74_00019937 [Ensete ventricosum]RZR92807.1 hypothetical protein BHM03_00021163 [Ensete ventricosum]
MWDPESNTSLFSLDDHGVFYRVTGKGVSLSFLPKGRQRRLRVNNIARGVGSGVGFELDIRYDHSTFNG